MIIKKLMKPEFCYWIGLVQTDGCFRKHYTNKHQKFTYVIEIESKDIEHLKLFQKVSSNFLKRKVKIHKVSRKFQNSFQIRIGVSKLLNIFSQLKIDFSDPPKPPNWLINDNALFGAYLSGVIDGDGNIRIKRPKYPQCIIRISSGKPQILLQRYIKKKYGCSCTINKQYRETVLNKKIIKGTCYNLEFLVSSKNYQFINNFTLPWIQLPRKRKRLEKYIKMRWARQDSNLRSPARLPRFNIT